MPTLFESNRIKIWHDKRYGVKHLYCVDSNTGIKKVTRGGKTGTKETPSTDTSDNTKTKKTIGGRLLKSRLSSTPASSSPSSPSSPSSSSQSKIAPISKATEVLDDDLRVKKSTKPKKIKDQQLIDSTGSDKIFNPKEIIDIVNLVNTDSSKVSQMSEEDVMYNLFLKQIEDTASQSSYDNNNIDNELNQQEGNILRRKLNKVVHLISNKKLIETPIVLEPDCPIEIVYKSRIVFANFVSKRENSNALNVRLAAGTMAVIDVGQIISCWDLLADETPPTTVEDWAQTAADALEILGNMSPRKSDLNEFWKLVSRRSLTIHVDSLDLGIYIFQERNFRTWIDPLIDASDTGVRALSSSQRYAAALLLFHDDYHFKHKKSSFYMPNADIDDEIEIGNEEEVDVDVEDIPPNSVLILEGAYKALDDGVSMFKEGESFFQYYNERVESFKSNDLIGDSTSTSSFDACCFICR